VSADQIKPNAADAERSHTNRQWVEGLLVSAAGRQWFGTITIQIRRGEIELVESKETLKPPAHCARVESGQASKNQEKP